MDEGMNQETKGGENKAELATAANAPLYHFDHTQIHNLTNSNEGSGLVASL